MAIQDYINRYLQAYEPSIQRESNRADAQMASRGLYRSTAGAGYADAQRQNLMGQAYREALGQAETARNNDMTNLRAQERNVSEALNTQYGYTLGMRNLAENPKYKVAVNPSLQKILDRYYKGMGDARESAEMDPDWLRGGGTDFRRQRVTREMDIQEQDNLAQQAIARSQQRLAQRSMAADQENQAWERDPRNIFIATLRDMMAAGALTPTVDPVTGEMTRAVSTDQVRGLYSSLLGKDIATDFWAGDPFAKGVVDIINDAEYRASLATRPPMAPPAVANEVAEPTFWERIVKPSGASLPVSPLRSGGLAYTPLQRLNNRP